MKLVSFALLLSSVVASDKSSRSLRESSSSSSSSVSSSSDEEILRKVKLSLLSLSGGPNPSSLGLCEDDPYFAGCGEPDLCDKSAKASDACCACGGGYVFFPYAESNGSDMMKVETVPEAFTACSSDCACKGFNSNGYVKEDIKPTSDWSTWTKDPFLGMYVKQKSLIKLEETDANGVCGYRYIPFLDCGYNDIKRFNEGSVSEFGEACDGLDACVAFNTAGYLKKKMQPQKWYYQLTEDPDVGFYVKIGGDCPSDEVMPEPEPVPELDEPIVSDGISIL